MFTVLFELINQLASVLIKVYTYTVIPVNFTYLRKYAPIFIMQHIYAISALKKRRGGGKDILIVVVMILF